LDHQVKIHGFRIELGEIEAVLSQHPAVREAVVIAREDNSDDKRLVAYLVAHQHATLSTGDLRAFLRTKLPDYMVPAIFMVLEALPLTPNGKVDRRRLPAPEETRADQRRPFMPPRDTLEFQLTKIWEEVLGVQSVGIQDDFFELGGHSLRAVRLMVRIEKLMGKRLPLATLLQSPTVASPANLLRQDGGPSPWAALV